MYEPTPEHNGDHFELQKRIDDAVKKALDAAGIPIWTWENYTENKGKKDEQ